MVSSKKWTCIIVFFYYFLTEWIKHIIIWFPDGWHSSTEYNHTSIQVTGLWIWWTLCIWSTGKLPWQLGANIFVLHIYTFIWVFQLTFKQSKFKWIVQYRMYTRFVYAPLRGSIHWNYKIRVGVGVRHPYTMDTLFDEKLLYLSLLAD